MKICIVKKQLQGKTAMDKPKELFQVNPPLSEKQQWMGYEKKYFPLGIYDENGVLDKSSRMCCDITAEGYYGQALDPPPVVSVAFLSNAYWFACPAPYVFLDELTITFSVKDKEGNAKVDPAPLVWKLRVDKDVDGNPPPPSQEIDLMDDNEQLASKAHATSKLPAKRSLKGAEATLSAAKKSKNVGRSASRAFFSSGDEILGFPAIPAGGQMLYPKYRLHRQLEILSDEVSNGSSSSSSSSKAGTALFTIQGSVLEARMPHSLMVALLDDKAHVETLRSFSRLGWDVHQMEQMRSNAQRPTANELFLKLQQSKSSNVPDSDKIVQHMRDCFECLFESCILYTEEKELLKEKLKKIKDESCKFADAFGPYYFLRFVVFFVTGGDSMSLGKDSAASAPQRRDMISNRLHKTAFNRLQELVDAAVKMLDDHAQAYFC